MEKIVSLFKRDYNSTRLVYDEIVPGAEWVPAGEGVATRKWDGTCCLVRAGRLFKRYDAKQGKTPPVGFEPAQPEPDPVTGHWPGWLEVGNGNEDRWHREACGKMGNPDAVDLPDGTYELCGPKVQGNPEGFATHTLVRHGEATLPDAPRTFGALKDYFASANIEGIVWHHSAGRMVKIKGKDFGIRRGLLSAPLSGNGPTMQHSANLDASVAALAKAQDQVFELVEALRPFVTGSYAEEVLEAAALAQWDDRLRLPVQYTQHVESALTVGDLRRAAAAFGRRR